MLLPCTALALRCTWRASDVLHAAKRGYKRNRGCRIFHRGGGVSVLGQHGKSPAGV